MNVKEIIIEKLKSMNCDGLCNPDFRCGCSIDNLMPLIPCFSLCLETCKPAIYNKDHEIFEEIQRDDKYYTPKEIIDYIDEIESVIGKKDDNGKTDWSLLPMSTLEGVVKVLMFGEKKYSRDSWQKVDNAKNRYFSALMRHLVKWLDGEKIDSESGLEHIDHALCCLIFLRWFEKDK